MIKLLYRWCYVDATISTYVFINILKYMYVQNMKCTFVALSTFNDVIELQILESTCYMPFRKHQSLVSPFFIYNTDYLAQKYDLAFQNKFGALVRFKGGNVI